MAKLSERNEYLEAILEKTRHYTDLIEKEAGIGLGETSVRRMLYIPAELVKQTITELQQKDQKDFLDTFLAPIVLAPIFAGYSIISLRDNPALYFHPTETIFINTRKKVRRGVKNSVGIDRLVVHELGHKLWYKLGGENDSKNPRDRMMQEGFATYCDTERFAHLYPTDETLDFSHLWGHADYQAGGLRMMRFIRKYGKEVFSEIPRRWRDLDKETPMIEPEILVSNQEQLRAFEGSLDYSD
ncbi:MAG TPA: hypothetical protein VJA23_06460 [Candidatus Nanoarchaeia archaeon]|nr:hypothetical protein [Candidatus Nanoarchaeia archaeon]